MTTTLRLYGFGSFFGAGRRCANDVDILLVHQDASPGSIAHAIRCKKILQSALPAVDVVMLSECEAGSSDFVRKSAARLLGNVSTEFADQDIGAIVISLGVG